MMPTGKTESCLIIGGGLSGLMAATVLQRQGVQVNVLDKGRGIGGRLATRRMRHPVHGEGVFDYGAQFFTVSDPRFQHWVDDWLQTDIVVEWSGQQAVQSINQPCYRGLKSNRSIAQYLAQDLTVHTQTRVTQILHNGSQWTVQAESGSEEPITLEDIQGDTLIITVPMPQTLDLLDQSGIPLLPSQRQRLEAITYQPCIAILALLDGPSTIPVGELPGGMRLEDDALGWLACNQQKGISPKGVAVTLHATPEFSHAHWEADDAVVAQVLLDSAATWLGAIVVDSQVHRWRYSQPAVMYSDPYAVLQNPAPIVLAGDGFAHPADEESGAGSDPTLNLERAALSGIAAANYILSQHHPIG